MKIIVKRKPITQEALKYVYDVMNKNIKNQKCFYTNEQIKALKKDKNTSWL